MNFLEEQSLTQTQCEDVSNRLKCQFPDCLKTFTTTNGRKSHMDREHRGKKYKCKFCTKRLASEFSVHRHILSIHSYDENEEDNEKSKSEVVYDRVDEIVPQPQEDTMIQQQAETIEKLENDWKKNQQEIKSLREQLKSMHSYKRNSKNVNQ